MIKIEAKDIELVGVNTLVPHPKNMNSHSPEQIERLCKLIKYQGFRNPIVVQKGTNLIVAGHGRQMAAKKMGLEKVPVTYQEFESDAQLYAYLVSDNAIAAWSELDLGAINTEMLDLGPDFDIDMLGLKDFAIEPAEKYDEAFQDEVPETLPEPKVVRGEVYILGKHRLMCGDSTLFDDVERLTETKNVDMVFTDPPYGIGFKYNSHKDSTGDEYMDFCRDWFQNLITKAEFIVISTGWAYNKFWYSYDPKDCFYWICKNKRTGGSVSHFRKVEPLFIWGKPTNRYNFDFFEQTTQIEKELKGQHTCPKPVALIESILEGCKKSGVVLDVFGGSGTTMIASEKLGLASRLMEMDERYCGVILDRWQNFTGKKAHRESDKKPWDEIKAAE